MSNDFGGGNAVNTSTNTGPTYTDEDLSLLPHNNAGPAIIGVIWFLAFISAVFLVLRVYCKFRTNRGLWWDDYILIAAWISSVVDAACWTVAVVRFGYGKHIWDVDPAKIIPMILPMQTAGIFILLAVIWSKTAFGVTLLRITDGWKKILVWVTIVSTNLFLGLSILFNFVSCTPVNKAWDPTVPGSCWDGHTLIDYHIFAAAWSAAMDFVLSGMALILVWSLQMKTREKIGVGFAMSLGIFAGITSIIKTVELPTLLSKDIYDSTAVVYWGAAEAAVTIIAACIPVLRVLIRHVQSSAREYQRTDEGGTLKVGTKVSKTHTVVVSSKKQSTGDDRSDKSILATGGKILMTNDISINYQDRRDGDSVGCYEMDNV